MDDTSDIDTSDIKPLEKRVDRLEKRVDRLYNYLWAGGIIATILAGFGIKLQINLDDAIRIADKIGTIGTTQISNIDEAASKAIKRIAATPVTVKLLSGAEEIHKEDPLWASRLIQPNNISFHFLEKTIHFNPPFNKGDAPIVFVALGRVHMEAIPSPSILSMGVCAKDVNLDGFTLRVENYYNTVGNVNIVWFEYSGQSPVAWSAIKAGANCSGAL